MGEAVKRKRQPCRDMVHRDTASALYSFGREFKCPECGTVFLVTAGKWGYVYKGRKYCRYDCLRAVEGRDEK